MLVDELLRTKRMVATNLALRLPELQVWFDKHHPDKGVILQDQWVLSRDELGGESLRLVRGRVRILSEKEVTEFYRYRQRGSEPVKRLEYDKPLKGQKGDKDYSPVCLDFAPWCAGGEFDGEGVCYFLDELQLVYNCRNYASAPVEFPFYLSQHRKINDDIFVLTQQPQNVDKMFRSFAQQFLYINNLGKRRVGMFRLPAAFRWCAYEEMKTGTVPYSFAGWFRRDPELSECYNTAAGIGIVASRADKGDRAKGIPWQVAVAIPLALFALLFLTPVWGKMFVGKLGGGAIKTVKTFKPGVVRGAGSAPLRPGEALGGAVAAYGGLPGVSGQRGPLPGSGVIHVRDAVEAKAPSNSVEQDGVYYEGYAVEGTNLMVMLSDGRVFHAGVDRELTQVTTLSCVIGGRRYGREPVGLRVPGRTGLGVRSEHDWRELSQGRW
jgi:hypothetical protein